MLQRVDGEDVIVISQPAHAWVSGQLARDWGNDAFGDLQPYDEVCLATALHDVGFLDWETAPTLNTQTGLPHTFLELPTSLHLAIWTRGIQQVLKYDRYAALLVSMHFSHLSRTHPSESAQDRKLEEKFWEAQDELQTTLITSLSNDVDYAPFSLDQVILRNRRLLSLWDWMSLLLCMGFKEEKVVDNVPSADGITQIKMCPLENGKVVIEPWPFRKDAITIKCEGLQLLKAYRSEHEMRKGLLAASPVPIRLELVRQQES